MTTFETSLKTTTPYFIEYVPEDWQSYFQLVRTKDQAILYANVNLKYVYAHCFTVGIPREQVTVW